MKSNSPTRTRRPVGGFALLEAMVALLICAMGVLGVVGLQGAMTRAQTAATFRAEAAFLAQQLIGAMWTDRTSNLTTYNTSGTCNAVCTDWLARVSSRLPSGTATVTVTNAGAVSIDIRWTAAGDSQSRFTMATSIN